MTTSAFFSPARPSILRRLHDGPLGPYIDEYAARLVEWSKVSAEAPGSVRFVSSPISADGLNAKGSLSMS